MQYIKFVNTIDEPIGKLLIIQANNKPIVKQKTLDITENIVTILNVLNICLLDKVGNIIRAVISSAPITFIPITIVKDIRIDKLLERLKTNHV